MVILILAVAAATIWITTRLLLEATKEETDQVIKDELSQVPSASADQMFKKY